MAVPWEMWCGTLGCQKIDDPVSSAAYDGFTSEFLLWSQRHFGRIAGDDGLCDTTFIAVIEGAGGIGFLKDSVSRQGIEAA